MNYIVINTNKKNLGFSSKKECINHFKRFFPGDEYRKGQEKALEEIAVAFYQGYKYVVLDAPTGAGKSFINTAFARGFNSCYYTTPQNNLVDQIADDDVLSDYYTVLKGKNNYKCQNQQCKEFDKGPHSADECINNRDNAGSEDEMCCDAGYVHNYFMSEDSHYDNLVDLQNAVEKQTTCEYPRALLNALKSNNMLTNTFLYSISGFFNKRQLTIIDESHNLESVIFNFVDISLTSSSIPFYNEVKEEIEDEDKSPEELERFVTREFRDLCHKKIKMLDKEKKELVKGREASEESTKEDEQDYEVNKRIKDIQDKKEKVSDLLEKIDLIEDLDEEFVVDRKSDSEPVDGVVLKPLYCGDFFQNKIKPKSEYFLLSSATFANAEESLSHLDVSPSEVKRVSMDSHFPKENRPVDFRDVVDMRRSNEEKGKIGKMAAEIVEIMNKHSDHKGIIHSISYDRQGRLKQSLEDFGVGNRVLVHNKGNADEKLEEFKERDDNCVFISPKFEEGVDLEEDDARFNILLKMPNPYVGDARVSHRINERGEWGWYYMQAAVKTAQAYGRTTRSEDDWSKFYILDSSFDSWQFRKHRHKFQDWFLEAQNVL